MIHGNTYRYAVAAIDADGFGLRSVSAEGVPIAPPDQVMALTLTSGVGNVVLRWTAVIGAASYNIYRANSEAGLPTAAAISVSTNFYSDINNLVNGTTYYRRTTTR